MCFENAGDAFGPKMSCNLAFEMNLIRNCTYSIQPNTCVGTLAVYFGAVTTKTFYVGFMNLVSGRE